MAVSPSRKKRGRATHARLLYLLGSRRGTTYDMEGERLFLAFKPQPNGGKKGAPPPGDDVIISDRAVETDRIAELVREGPDRYELHPLRPWDEIVLNGTNRVPFQARPVLQHRDTVTVRGIVLQFLRVFGDGAADSVSIPSPADVSGLMHDPDAEEPVGVEGAREDIHSEVVATRPVTEQPGELSTVVKGPKQLTRLASAVGKIGALVGDYQAFAAGFNLRTWFQQFLGILLESYPDTHGSVLLFDKHKRTFRRAACIPEDGEPRVSRSIVSMVCRERAAVLSRDTKADPELALHKSIDELGIRSVLCVPMLREDRVYGLIHLDAEKMDAFDEEDLNLVAAVAPLALTAVRNATALEQLRSHDRVQSEKLFTRAVQQNLMAAATFELPGLEIAARVTEADEPGGDLFDAFAVHEGGGGFILMASTPLRGVTAGLLHTAARSVVRALCTTLFSPREILHRLSRRVREDATRNASITGTLLYWDATRGQFAIAANGPAPVILYQVAQGQASVFGIGPTGDDSMPDTDRGFAPGSGDLLVILSRGAILAGREDGFSELRRTVERLADEPAAAIAEGLRAVIAERFGETGPPHDATVVVIRRQ